MKKIKRKTILKKAIIFSLLLVAFIAVFNVKAQDGNDVSDQSDAIAVKIIPNPNHYSISTWYSNQGFVGSPQSLTVDGYEAIRDGRTVYVNAANVSESDIYTNIYVISYSQQPSEKTIDILGQIVSRWEFNDNLEDDFNEEPSTCAISSYNCDSDEDCSEGQYCSEEGETIGTCLLEEEKNCLIDDDCPSGYFCNSPKAIVIRDTKRIGMLEEMKTALSNYYQRNGNYPTFGAGTYLANKSISVWPSWKEKVLPEIAMSPTYVDTINRIGNCPGYDMDTCWNVEERKFFSEPDYQSLELELPENSYVMVYTTNSEGSEYNLCSSLETSKINKQFVPGDYSGSACQTNFTVSGQTGENKAPELVDFYLESQSDRELNGYIRVKDLNKDNLEWSLNTNMSDWDGWSSPPRLIDTSSNYEKKIYAEKTAYDPNRDYIIKIIVIDGNGGQYEEEFEIQINEPGIFIEAENSTHTLKVDVPFKYSLYFSGSTLPENIEDSNYEISTTTSPSIDVSNFIELDAPILEKVGINRYKLSYEGYIDPDDYQNDEFAEDVRLGFEVSVDDKNGREFSKEFYIDIISPKPPLDFSCPLTTRIRTDDSVSENNYSCNIGKKEYLNGEIEYSLSGVGLDNLGGNFEFIEGTNDYNQDTVYLRGYATTPNTVNTRIIAKSPYGAVSEKTFYLKGLTYCGDGILEEPNSEGKGGVYNDGYEQCERGGLGITSSSTLSSINKQYGCTISDDTQIPLEISTNNYCTFKGSLSGGGYCGDYVCQTRYEDIDNCAIDCQDENPDINVTYCEETGSCEAGYVCQESSGRCVEDSNYCENDDDCGNGLECPQDANQCEELCWDVQEKVSEVNFLGGDATQADTVYKYDIDGGGIEDGDGISFSDSVINNSALGGNNVIACSYNKDNNIAYFNDEPATGCTYVNLDNPRCVYAEKEMDNTLCPDGYTGIESNGQTGEDDTCVDVSGMFNDWKPRPKYKCTAYEDINRCYGDVCRIGNSLVENGIMNEEGECVNPETYGKPNTPLLYNPELRSGLDGPYVYIKWRGNESGIERYLLYIKKGEEGSYDEIVNIYQEDYGGDLIPENIYTEEGGSDYSYNYILNNPEPVYYFKITAIDGELNESPFSNIKSLETDFEFEKLK